MKKILAAVLSMTMSVAVLSACSSSGNTGEPVSATEEAVAEETAEATEEPAVTEETTEEPTEVAEATEEPADDNPNEDPYADGIIPLYNIMLEDQVKQTEPDLWFTNFDETVLPFYQLYTTDKTIDGCAFALFQLTDLAVEPIESVTLRGPEGTDYTTNVAIYIYEAYDLTGCCFETEDGTQHLESLVPFFYNEEKGCLVGYTRSNPENIRFVEVYWSAAGNTSRMIDVDPSEYGF